MALLHDASQSHEPPPLTPVQREILTALEGGRGTHVQERPAPPSPQGVRIGLGIFGILCLVVGTVAVFFFTIFGAILLFLGSATCVYALQAAAGAPEVPDRT